MDTHLAPFLYDQRLTEWRWFLSVGLGHTFNTYHYQQRLKDPSSTFPVGYPRWTGSFFRSFI